MNGVIARGTGREHPNKKWRTARGVTEGRRFPQQLNVQTWQRIRVAGPKHKNTSNTTKRKFQLWRVDRSADH